MEYRVVRSILNDKAIYDIREVYISKKNKVEHISYIPIKCHGDTYIKIKDEVNLIIEAFSKPILDQSTINETGVEEMLIDNEHMEQVLNESNIVDMTVPEMYTTFIDLLSLTKGVVTEDLDPTAADTALIVALDSIFNYYKRIRPAMLDKLK